MGRIGTGEFYTGKRRTNSIGVQVEDIRICVVMVGLPARGKSLIAQKGMFQDDEHTWAKDSCFPNRVEQLLQVLTNMNSSRSLSWMAQHQC